MAQEMSIEAVLRELQIDEAELEELIADGDLHPTGEGAARRFDSDEVHEIKARKEGYPTIPLPDIDDIRELLAENAEDEEGEDFRPTPGDNP